MTPLLIALVSSFYIGAGQPENSFQMFNAPFVNYGDQLAVGPDGNIWFRDSNIGRIGFITSTGVVTEYALPAGHNKPFGIATGPDNNLWVTDQNGNAIVRSTTGGVMTTFPLRSKNRPYDIIAGADGNLWFVALNLGTLAFSIGRITPSGTITLFPVPGSHSNVFGMALGADGNVWYANEASQTVGRVTPAGQITEFPAPNKTYPYALALGGDGNLYAAFYGHQATLLKITTSGQMSFVGPRVSNSFDAIARGPNGDVWGGRMCGFQKTCLIHVNIATGTVGQRLSPVYGWQGLIEGADGNIWFQTGTSGQGIGVFYP